jgi:D-alanine-D-alanine ligase-like ATP-grasp enzyme
VPTYIYQHFSPKGLRLDKRVSNSSRLVLKEAEQHGVSWIINPGTQVVQLSYAGKEASYYHQVPSSTTALAIYTAQDKKTTGHLLDAAGVSVPKGYRVMPSDTFEYHEEVYNALKKPLVVKPSNGDLGDNITIHITTYPEYQEALVLALSYDSKEPSAIVEEMFEGKEYRILATQDKVIGILNRVPANVIGDGSSSIRQLIAQKNAEEIRSEDGLHSHLKIKMDADLRRNIIKQGLTLDSILQPDQEIFLRKVSNISKGGDAIDCTDLAHPSVKAIALKAMRTIPGLAFGGIDFMTKDITKEQTSDSYVIVELNDSPGFDIHDAPYIGENRHAAQEFLYLMFPQLRIKKVLVP